MERFDIKMLLVEFELLTSDVSGGHFTRGATTTFRHNRSDGKEQQLFLIKLGRSLFCALELVLFLAKVS